MDPTEPPKREGQLPSSSGCPYNFILLNNKGIIYKHWINALTEEAWWSFWYIHGRWEEDSQSGWAIAGSSSGGKKTTSEGRGKPSSVHTKHPIYIKVDWISFSPPLSGGSHPFTFGPERWVASFSIGFAPVSSSINRRWELASLLVEVS